MAQAAPRALSDCRAPPRRHPVTAGVMLVVYAIVQAEPYGWVSCGTLIPLVLGVVLLAGLVLERVFESMEALGYVYNQGAASLRRQTAGDQRRKSCRPKATHA
ncbi:hypothetical protein Psi02_62680 [Planotetraspora silvatica]|uniref:Uncharacterized protein n=2 Tax=Planotetraspora silvatica TaxID=234614 RepID=A0A8J3UWS4_9ACTN|nr:hypothetical protein Psi02_62680 [Planotetraspora silvatica]